MDERTAALALEEEIAAVLAGVRQPVQAHRGDPRDSVELVEQLRALGVEWGRLTPPALQQEVASLADRAGVGVEQGFATRWPMPRRVLPISFAITAAATLLIVAIPAARHSVAHQLYRVLDTARVGPGTELVRPDSATAEEVAATLQEHDRGLATGRTWSIHTPYGGFGGVVPPRASPALQRVDRVDLLHSLTSMPIQMPAGSYRGATPTFSHALVAPDGFLLVFFGSEENEILLVQAPVGGGRAMSYSRVVTGTDKQGAFVLDSPELKTEEMSLGGRSVTWDPDTTGRIPNSSAMRWEREGVSYSLMGRALTRDEGVQLFLSLRPADTSRAK